MWTKEIIERVQKDWGIEVNDDTLFFYDRINLVSIKKGDNGYREYTEKDYIKLSKALVLARDFGVSLEDIDQMLNKRNASLISTFIKRKTKMLRILKETL